MYKNEVLFTQSFLLTLNDLGVNNIPYCNSRYRDGVREMKKYFKKEKENIDGKYHDIGLLFLDNGENDFARAIQIYNGNIISFELKNPVYEEAHISVAHLDNDILLISNDLNIPKSFLYGITKAFCNGAQIKYRKYEN